MTQTDVPACPVTLDCDDVIARLRAHEREFRSLGVTGLYLFGSVARGEAEEGSDVDLFFDRDPDSRFGLIEYMDLRDLAPEILGRQVDIMSRQGIHYYIRDRAIAEAIPVFA